MENEIVVADTPPKADEKSRWFRFVAYFRSLLRTKGNLALESDPLAPRLERARLDERQLDYIEARKEILDWRDRWVDTIDKQLERESFHLIDKLNRSIDRLTYKDTLDLEKFIDSHLAPIFHRWTVQQSENLIDSAKEELKDEVRHIVKAGGLVHNLRNAKKNRAMADVTKAGLSTTATIAAIPAAISLSTSTVSAGGLMGLLGATTMVVSAPVAIVGAGVVASLAALSGKRIKKIKENACSNLKTEIRDTVRAKVIYSGDRSSLRQHLQSKIEDSATMLLKELRHGR
jgi:hypothetical protein